MVAIFFDYLLFILLRLFVAGFLFIWQHQNTMNDDERREIAKILANVDEPTIREIVREAESFLEAQLKAALAADQRAMALAAMAAAVTAILIGGTVSLIAAKVSIWPHILVIAPIFIGLFIAMFSAVSAAKPVNFRYTGNNPKFWAPDVARKQSLVSSLAGQAALYAQGIEENKGVLEDNHRNVKRALSALIYGITFAAAIEFAILMGMLADRGIH